jgi:hypothetical protein
MPINFIEKLQQSMSYADFRKLTEGLLAEGKTTGTNQSEDMLKYAKLSEQRMHRWDKTGIILPETVETINHLQKQYILLVITEGWCGDSAQTLPFINKIAESSPNMTLRILLRDEHLDLIDQYLTNGGRSIPKLLLLNKDTLQVLNTWGPRPIPAQQIVLDWKQNQNMTHDEAMQLVHTWYAKDQGKTFQQELLALFSE